MATLVKEHAEQFGDRQVKPHIICRELAKFKGKVTMVRPKSAAGRAKHGSIYIGVCAGDPRTALPADIATLEAETGLMIGAALAELVPPAAKGSKTAVQTKTTASKTATKVVAKASDGTKKSAT